MRAAVVLVLVATACLRAQQYTREQHRLLPPGEHGAAVAVDFDGDGDLDLAVRGSSLRLLENDGTGRFTSRGTYQVNGSVLAAGDVDGDGDPDLVVGGRYSSGPALGYLPGTLLRNDGSWTFSNGSGQWQTVAENTLRVSLVDWEGDGDLDVLTGSETAGPFVNPQPVNRLYLNNGSGSFTDVTAARLPIFASGAFAAGDVDGDGDADIVYGGRNPATVPAPLRVLLQNAGGVAVEAVGAVNPTPSSAPFTDVALCDHDLDGDLDLAVASAAAIETFANSGNGSFSSTGVYADANVRAWTVADVDRDGRPDLLAERAAGGLPLPWRHYRSTAAGFVDATSTTVEHADFGAGLLAFDADGDQDLEVLASVPDGNAIWHGDGQGRLLLVTSTQMTSSIGVAAVADGDGDGALDLALIEDGRVVVVRDVAGRHARIDVPYAWTSTNPPFHVAWIDADHDGDGDLVVATHLGPVLLFHDAGGAFVDVTAQHLLPIISTSIVQTADIDGDGNLDLLFGGALLAHCLRGNGAGGFVDASWLLPPGSGGEFAALDIDGDGDLDLAQALALFWNVGALRVLRNDGPAGFVDVTVAVGASVPHAYAVAASDVDGDGRRDLLVGIAVGTGQGLVVLRATPNGFVDETSLRAPTLMQVGMIALVDLELDGDDDVLLRRSGGGPQLQLRNDNGVLTPFTSPSWSYSDVMRAVAADFDRDGDQDLVLRRGVYRNVARDVASAVPPRLGMPAELVLRANAGDGTNAQLALLLVAPASVVSPLPLGSLGALALDPTSTVLHSVHMIAANGGEATVAYTVGSAPALLGATVHAQAAFLHTPQPSSWRLGNSLKLSVRL